MRNFGIGLLGAVVGSGLAFGVMTLAQYRGCSVDLKFAAPPSLRLDCAGAPHQLPLNFGSQPSRMTLGKALTIVAERTQSAGLARVYVASEILQNPVAAVSVDPPSGTQPSLILVQQLLAQARAANTMGICLVPEGGYRVQILR